jgi:hypothetical protein
MKLDHPFWVLVDPAGKEIVWDYEGPLTSDQEDDLADVLEHRIQHAEKHGAAQNHDSAWWKAVTIQKVTLNRIS